MKALKVSAVLSFFAFGLLATSAFAEIPSLPSNISPDDHTAAAAFYENLAKEETAIVERYQQELEEHEDHAFFYGRRGQDQVSHLRANIREHKHQLEEELAQAALYRKLSTAGQQVDRTSSADASAVNAAVVR
ncbi:hypothetical protein [Nitrosomonas sp.]|uniref:hypothetical protein n=1 Tax=Nitrosomonas sp. TaxID=42353 RepID=UPI001D744E9D|nr:hypothetical protein [Nitrosomonas sp.]MBX3615847.1 hypothetical protein [Nitrosomonas sp.]